MRGSHLEQNHRSHVAIFNDMMLATIILLADSMIASNIKEDQPVPLVESTAGLLRQVAVASHLILHERREC